MIIPCTYKPWQGSRNRRKREPRALLRVNQKRRCSPVVKTFCLPALFIYRRPVRRAIIDALFTSELLSPACSIQPRLHLAVQARTHSIMEILGKSLETLLYVPRYSC